MRSKNYVAFLLLKILFTINSFHYFLLVHNFAPSLSQKMALSKYETNSTLNLEIIANPRKKRQDVAGGSTSVIGARITREATAGDWQDANFAVNNPAPSRGKRSVENWYHFKKFYIPLPAPPAPTSRPLTRTQDLFTCVNQDYYYAQKFTESKVIQANSVLRENIIINKNGIKCHHVCDREDGVGFGLLGFCTHRYCRCDTSHRKLHVEYICPLDKVFDPVTLWCQRPQDSVLCFDPKPTVFEPSVFPIWGTDGPNFIHGWKKWK